MPSACTPNHLFFLLAESVSGLQGILSRLLHDRTPGVRGEAVKALAYVAAVADASAGRWLLLLGEASSVLVLGFARGARGEGGGACSRVECLTVAEEIPLTTRPLGEGAVFTTGGAMFADDGQWLIPLCQRAGSRVFCFMVSTSAGHATFCLLRRPNMAAVGGAGGGGGTCIDA